MKNPRSRSRRLGTSCALPLKKRHRDISCACREALYLRNRSARRQHDLIRSFGFSVDSRILPPPAVFGFSSPVNAPASILPNVQLTVIGGFWFRVRERRETGWGLRASAALNRACGSGTPRKPQLRWVHNARRRGRPFISRQIFFMPQISINTKATPASNNEARLIPSTIKDFAITRLNPKSMVFTAAAPFSTGSSPALQSAPDAGRTVAPIPPASVERDP